MIAARDRGQRIAAIQSFIGSDITQQLYDRLGLSPEWIDPIFGLDDLERLATWIYTSPNIWHSIINQALWHKPVPADIAVFAEILTGALRKLPRFQGVVYRGVFLAQTHHQLSQRYKKGRRLIWPAFTSAARDVEKAYVGNVLFRIRSSFGRAIQSYSADSDADDEVIFEPETRFLVHDMVVDTIIVADLIEIA